jgi:hypothetical protein
MRGMRLRNYTMGIGFGAVALGAFLAAPGTMKAAAPTPTYTKDIAPIFQEKCEACHRPESMAPMSLTTFDDARPFAKSIKTRVSSREMPPWGIDRTVGIQQFKNDRSLTDQQVETIVAWVDAGAPKGDPKDMPVAKVWPKEQGWNFAAMFGEPDLIIKSPTWTQKAGAQDAWDKRTTPSGLTEARVVRAIEIRPSSIQGRKVVHHAIARLQQDDPAAAAQQANDGDAVAAGPGTFMEWAVGKQGEIMRPDTGKLMLPGASFVWDIHYSASTEDVTTQAEMAIYFYPKGQEPKYRQTLGLYGTGGIDIPPGQIKATQGFHVLAQNARIESFQPHMHLRGKAMTMEAILPNGQTQVLSQVSNFNFAWMTSYYYADDAAPLLPKGTIIHVTAWHDNTPAKKSNPDPNQWVGGGDRTVDDMAHAWVNVSFMNDKDFKAEQDARKARQAESTQQQQQ